VNNPDRGVISETVGPLKKARWIRRQETIDEMATEYSDKRRKHLLEVKEDAGFFVQSSFGRLLEGFQKEFGDSLEK